MTTIIAVLFLLLSLPIASIHALKCGSGFWTKDCIGDTDKRYDPDTSINIVDQSENWKKREGYYETVEYNYGPDYQIVDTIAPFPDVPQVSFVLTPNTRFENHTFVGSRFYLHVLFLLKNVNPFFPGAAVPTDTYSTSTFEKDGSILTMPFTAELAGGGVGNTDEKSIGYPVGDDTVFSLRHSRSDDGQESITYQVNTCLDPNCDKKITVRQTVTEGVLTQFAAGESTRLTEEEYIQRVNQAYIDVNIMPDSRIPVPLNGSCLKDCITEEDWCDNGDPSCNESPYQEPDGKLTTGAIVIISLGSFVVTVLVVLIIVRIVVKNQEQRYRSLFATRIAQTIDLQKSMKSLTPSVLANEFAKIDEANDGKISKDELWTFLNSNGGDGDDNIRQRDFNALWAALDTRGTGQVDFLEFCAFFSDCQDEYDEARRKNPKNRASVRQSLASSMTLKYNEVSKVIESQAMEPGTGDAET